MKIVATVLARDEADIIDAQIAFHLNAGVDFIVATDNLSTDGTTDIFESYARDGYLHLLREDANTRQQGAWVTRMARMAATDFGADWVINTDADEFWWPREGSFKEIFSAVPRAFGAVRGMVRHFAPRPESKDSFAEKMTVRVCNPGTYSNSPWSPLYLTTHRADPDVEVTDGNHAAIGHGLQPLKAWYPIDVLHFPIRSVQQAAHKFQLWWELILRGGGTLFGVRAAAYDAYQRGRMDEFYDSFVVDDAELERGLAAGTLAVDTRLRDALRTLRKPERDDLRRFGVLPDGKPLRLANSTVDEAYLSELGRLAEAGPEAVLQRRIGELEGRLGALEQSPLARARRRLSS